MFPTVKATSFFLPTIRCGAAKPWPAIFSSSTPCSTSPTRRQVGHRERPHHPPHPPAPRPAALAPSPAVGRQVSPATCAEAEKLVQVQLTTADRTPAAETWRENLPPLYERRPGPRTSALEQ